MAQNLGFPEDSFTLPDSIGFQLPEAKDSLKSIGQLSNEYSNNPIDTINKMEQRVEGLKMKIEDSIRSIKVLKDTEIIKGEDKMGDIKVSDEAEKALPELKDGGDITEFTGPMEGIQDKPQGHLDEIKEVNEARSAQEQLSKPKEISSQAKGYTNEAKEISQGNFEKAQKLPQEAEKRVDNLDGMQELKKQAAELEALKSTPEQYQKQAGQYTGQEFLKGQGKKQLKEKAIQHFAQHQDKLKAAMSKLSKKKKKFSLFGNGEGKKENPLKDKPFKERLYLGGNFQLHQGNPLSVDLSPLVGYQFTQKLSAGLGGTYRQSFKKEYLPNYAVVQDVYGFRAFGEYMAIKSFFIHAESESMNMKQPDPAIDDKKRIWVNGALAGVGKQFTISKKLKGKMTLLYNFLHDDQDLYREPLMVRFGFEI